MSDSISLPTSLHPADDARPSPGPGEEGVAPDDKTRPRPADGAVAVPPLPVKAEENRRGEDGDGDKETEPHVHQGEVLPHRDGEEVARQDETQDDEPLDVREKEGKAPHPVESGRGRG